MPFVVALASMLSLTSFVRTENGSGQTGRGYGLVSLWKEYDKASEADRPQAEERILEKIKKEAFGKRLPLDYYDACRKYVRVKSRVNWKLRDSLMAALGEEVRAYGDPLVSFLYAGEYGELDKERLLGQVKRDSGKLKASYTPSIHKAFSPFGYREGGYGDMVVSLIRNDYEYALWKIMLGHYLQEETLDEVWTLLSDELGGRYPEAALAEYEYLSQERNEKERLDAYGRLAAKYEGKAVALFPLHKIMLGRFGAMGDKASSEEYLAFRETVRSYENWRKMFRSGTDAAVAKTCDGFGKLLETLEEKNVRVDMGIGKAVIMFRNLDGVVLDVKKKDGVSVHKVKVENPVRSFYAYDTVEVALPAFDDGRYNVEARLSDKPDDRQSDRKNQVFSSVYNQNTLSLACRRDADGYRAYAADYMSGEPVADAVLVLYKGDREVARTGNMHFDGGFVPLPSSLVAAMSGNSAYRLECISREASGRLRSSEELYLYNHEMSTVREDVSGSGVSAEILKDRSAFRADDTLRFKGILYSRGQDGGMSVLPEGKEVIARLCDARGEEVSRQQLRTGTYGSVAGEFALSAVSRKGMCRIELLSDGDVAGVSYFRADDFVLPTFSLEFDEPEAVYFPGDTVVVSGKVVSFSGHPLSGMSAEAVLKVDGKTVSSGPVVLGDDGRFSVGCVAGKKDAGYCAIMAIVRLTDATGETLEFTHLEQAGGHLPLNAVFAAEKEGQVEIIHEDGSWRRSVIVAGEKTGVMCEVLRPYGGRAVMPLEYRLVRDGETVCGGRVMSGDSVSLDFSGKPSGIYGFVLEIPADVRPDVEINRKETYDILKVREGEVLDDSRIGACFMPADGEDIALDLVCGEGPVWAVAELFGDRARLLSSGLVCLEPGLGHEGCAGRLAYEYLPEYPDAVVLNVIYFKDGRQHSYSREWARPRHEDKIDVEFSSFTDRAFPGTECTVILKTDPEAEVLVSVFDVSTEKIMPLSWNLISHARPSVRHVYVQAVTGRCRMDSHDLVAFDGNIGYAPVYKSAMTRSAAGNSADEICCMEDETGLSFVEVLSDAVEAGAEVSVREDFASTLAFMPFLRASDDGTVRLSFRTGGKLSTFAVCAYAHDKSVRTASARREMLVTLPLKVSVSEPLFLVEGDRYVMRASVSNSSSVDISGKIVFGMYEGTGHKETVPVATSSDMMTVPAGGTAVADFEVTVPALGSGGKGSGADVLGFKVVFTGDGGLSDGLFVTVPVCPASQTLTEAHSAVLLPGMSEDDLVGRLRGQFVNMTSSGAEYSEMRLYDMLMEALPSASRNAGRDVISLSETLYLDMLYAGFGAEHDAAEVLGLIGKISACANADGGFGWFEGMPSSPVVTAVVLERYASLRDRGLLSLLSAGLGEDDLDDFSETICRAVEYLDMSFFGTDGRPAWCGSVSQEQYMYVRSFYAGIPLDADAARKSMGTERFRLFRKSVKEYLVPSGKRGMNGRVLGLARRMRILCNLSMSDQGRALAKEWGVSVSGRLGNSLAADLRSLLDYAVVHPSGGRYFPNAVMPWRGLLESEAYAHAVICDLLGKIGDFVSDKESVLRAADVADGIRIWIMLQNETQKWEAGSGFAEAMASVCDGSDRVRDTKVIVLKKRMLKPFADITPAGNGFRITVKYYKESPDAGLVELAGGEPLDAGDKIVAKYQVWSGENRSFVRLDVPRPAALRPVKQLSGWSGGWFRPLSSGVFSISPSAYREVLADRTLYWFDVFPEENSEISEEFFVIQKGIFSAAAPEVESLYAPHYRANSACPEPLVVL